MKKLILSIVIAMAFSSSFGQTIVKDSKGNFVQVDKRKKVGDSTHTSAKQTNLTFTDRDGKVYPVMESKNGKLFVIRTSKKTGLLYNMYLPKNLQP